MNRVKALDEIRIQQFIREGYVKLENAFAPALAEKARSILWKDTNCDPNNPSTWTRPLIRLGEYGQEPFVKAINSPLLHSAFDQLAGKGNWLPRNTIGTFPVRFPAPDDPGDTGWHVDASFPGEDPGNYFEWKINVRSKGRALLMLFLFSDVDDMDAPTGMYAGSHREVAGILEPHGEAGLTFMEVAQKLTTPEENQIVHATGKAGTVYLCHPFLAHAAQRHCGKNPRFMAQPALPTNKEFDLHRIDGDYSPVEQAIRNAIGRDNTDPQ